MSFQIISLSFLLLSIHSISCAPHASSDSIKIDENPRNYCSGTTNPDSENVQSPDEGVKRAKRQDDGGLPDEDVTIFTDDDQNSMTTTKAGTVRKWN